MATTLLPVFGNLTKKIHDTVTVYSDKKIQFRDTGVYIQSSADGKLLISSDGTGADDITLSGAVTITGDVAHTGDMTITGSLTVTQNFAFGDAAADTITMTGDIVWASCSPSYCIDMALASPSTAELRFSDNATIDNLTNDVLTITETYVDLAVTALRFTSSGNIDGALTIRDNFTVGRTGAEVSFTLKGYQLISGTADYPLDMSAATANTADIRLMNDALVDNTTNGTLKLQTTASGYVSISEGTTTIKTDYLDLELTTALRFTSGLNVDGALVFRDAVTIGRSGAEVKLTVLGYQELTGTADYGVRLAGASTFAIGFDVENGAATTGLHIGTATTGISLDGTQTTGISISGNSTDAIKIQTGTIVDGIDIAIGCSTAGINFSAAQLNCIKSVYNVAAQLGQYVQGIKIEHTRSADIQPSTGGWWGMQVVLNAGTGYTALDQPAYVIHGVFKGDATDPDTDCINVARFETQSDGKVEDLLFVSANSGSTVTGDIARFVAHVAPTRSILALQNGTVGSTPAGLYIDVDETMTTAIHLQADAAVTAAMDINGTVTYFADLDGCSGANGTITSDSGSAATTWKARIKVKTDDGTDGWVNVYSTSNEA
jgi:hypothetical protein